MNLLLENPLPAYTLGAVLATFAVILFLTRRDLPSLGGVLGVLVLTLVLVLLEAWVVTDQERIEAAIEGLVVALEQNDLPGVLKYVDPAAAEVRADAEKLMPMMTVRDAGAGVTAVEVNSTTQPQTATAELQFKLDGIHIRSGVRMFYVDRVQVNWMQQDDAWLLTGYTAYYDGQPIDAVSSVRGNSPVPQ